MGAMPYSMFMVEQGYFLPNSDYASLVRLGLYDIASLNPEIVFSVYMELRNMEVKG